jgi:hypothetical protein
LFSKTPIRPYEQQENGPTHRPHQRDTSRRLAAANARAAVVRFRFFAGLTGEQAAAALGVSPRAADSLWAHARAWLFERMHPDRL